MSRGAVLIVPSGRDIEVTAALDQALAAQLPHPECGSRKPRSNYLILVITGVDPGDRGRPRRSVPKSTCWPTVGGQADSRVDTWTSRRPPTPAAVSPRPVPCLPQRPSPVRTQVRVPGAVATGVRRARSGGTRRSGRQGGGIPRGGRSGGHVWPVVTAGERARRDLPNLCTSLGTTRRPVDRGHRYE